MGGGSSKSKNQNKPEVQNNPVPVSKNERISPDPSFKQNANRNQSPISRVSEVSEHVDTTLQQNDPIDDQNNVQQLYDPEPNAPSAHNSFECICE